MWKKEDAPNPPSAPPAEPQSRPDRLSRGTGLGGPATIGPSISIRGEVTGDEDLLIQGRVDGSVDLKQHSVTVGPEGKVKAGIAGRIVVVEGSVEGDLRADEQVILRSSASVQGDISAPRVVLEDGARFRGGVDMGDPADRGRTGGGSGASAQSSGKAPGGTPSSGSANKGSSGKEKESAGASAGSKG